MYTNLIICKKNSCDWVLLFGSVKISVFRSSCSLVPRGAVWSSILYCQPLVPLHAGFGSHLKQLHEACFILRLTAYWLLPSPF